MENQIPPSSKCPCGSSKKYKKCCGANSDSNLEQKYRLIRETENSVFIKSFEIIHDDFPEIFEEALDTFARTTGEAPEDIDATSEEVIQHLFSYWLIGSFPGFLKVQSGKNIYLTFGEFVTIKNSRYNKYFNHAEQLFLSANSRSITSWFQVNQVNPSVGLELKDLFTDSNFEIRESAASQILSRGSIIFARVVNLYGINFLAGISPYPLNESDLLVVIKARNALLKEFKNFVDQEELPLWFTRDIARIKVFSELISSNIEISNLPLSINNTDGDPMEFLDVVFKIHDSVEDVLTKLKQKIEACDNISLEELIVRWNKLSVAKQNKVGLKFDLFEKGKNKALETIIVGRATIYKNSLIVEVNSSRRAKKIRQEFTKILGNSCKPLIVPHLDRDEENEKISENTDLLHSPEFIKELTEKGRQHIEMWYKTKIPMLDNKTPIQAAKTKQGRELLEALLIYYEKMESKNSPQNLSKYFSPNPEEVRIRLGLR